MRYSLPSRKKHGAAPTCVERIARIERPWQASRATGKSHGTVASLPVIAQRRADSREDSAPASSSPRGRRRRSDSRESAAVYSGYGPARPEGHLDVFGNSLVSPDLRGRASCRGIFPLGGAPSRGGSLWPIYISLPPANKCAYADQ